MIVVDLGVYTLLVILVGLLLGFILGLGIMSAYIRNKSND